MPDWDVIVALVFVHVSANIVWVGSILAVAVILSAKTGDAVTRGTLGQEIYKRLSTPAFSISFVFGTLILVLRPEYYFVVRKFMHAKLLFAAVVIGVHHALGARARRMAQGTVTEAGPSAVLAGVLLASAVAAAYLALLEPF